MAPFTTGTTAPLPLRLLLRAATHDVHQRLHRHDGFAAIQDATISRIAYRALLARLYGFYVPFEAAVAAGHDRSRWLRDDLGTLGMDGQAFDALPACPYVPRLNNPGRRLGALYVAEGSALGGRDLGRSLAVLLGVGVEGRRFFVGRGAGTGAAWRSFLAQLSAADELAAQAEIVGGAVETFAALERWLTGWSVARHDG